MLQLENLDGEKPLSDLGDLGDMEEFNTSYNNDATFPEFNSSPQFARR